ncbi:hypothetical protein A2U01_0063253, partial [Trifolium medium]|nr:hypothetical protein [Trifolium medium]
NFLSVSLILGFCIGMWPVMP